MVNGTIHWRAVVWCAAIWCGLVWVPGSVCRGDDGGRALSVLTELRVRSWVEAEHRQVSLLDLCDPSTIADDWRRVLSAVDIGPAPHVGSRKYIRSDLLRDYLRHFLRSEGFDPDRVRLILPKTITIERRSIALSIEEIEKAYREYILAHAPWNPADLVIGKINISGLPTVPAGERHREITGPEHDEYLGNVVIAIHYYVDGEKVRTLRVAGKVSLMANVIHARRALQRDLVIGKDDLMVQRINVGSHPDLYATRLEQVVGLQPRRELAPNEPIRIKELCRPIVVKRGDPVTIFYETPGFRLTAKGLVKENAAVGDRIRVMNVSSKRTIYCQVLDSKRVAVTP